MRNVQLLRQTCFALNSLAATCRVLGDIFAIQMQNGFASVRNVSQERDITTFDVPEISPGQGDEIMDFHYDEVENRLCIIMRGGDIITIALEPNDGTDQVDIVGAIDQHVLSALWSPDNEVLAIVTQSSLTLLTTQFDILAEVPISEDDVKASSNQVSVGWGRTETQFRGKRMQRDPTLPEVVDSGRLSKADLATTSLSWRGDANYLCVSCVTNNRRVIRTYSRDGILESTSEPVDGQTDGVSWKPDGSVISAIQDLSPSTSQCIFFEKNGLRHGQFDLRTTSKVLSLKWNSDSSVLAILYVDHVDLWSSSNYHYALKARFTLGHATKMAWHDEEPLKLIVNERDSLVDLDLRWNYSSHDIKAPNDLGVMAVIDGTSLGLTPLRLANVPPPMSFRTLTLPDVPRDVAISGDTRHLVVLLESQLLLFKWDLQAKPIRAPDRIASWPLETESTSTPLQVVHRDNGTIFVLFSTGTIVQFRQNNTSSLQFSQQSQARLMRSVQDGIVLLADSEFEYLPEDLASAKARLQYPSISCHTFEVYQSGPDADLSIVALSRDGKLYYSEQCVASKVTSFILIGKIIAYTTANHLNFIMLDQDNSIQSNHELDTNSDLCRSIERGSLVLCACPTAQSIVLQAPRGNLETIYPRLLVLSSVRSLIDADEWQKAWRLTKLHRIDPNILYDLQPEKFLRSLKAFIEALKTPTELDIFLTVLKPEDVCLTMYPDMSLQHNTEVSQVNQTDKVNTICDALLSELLQRHSKTHLSSILTAHLTKTPSGFEAALALLATLSDADKEYALTHVCFLADPNILYTQALALYDLHSALLLAQRSQKDPREYVPFLQKIQALSPERQRFTLDDHLGRPAKALSSLVKIEDAWEEECIDYISRHTIWTEALDLLKYEQSRYTTVLALYAEYLLEIQDHAAAGYAFESVKDFPQATLAFERAGLWREALHNAKLASLSISQVAERLRDQMVDRAQFLDAADISQTHLGDTKLAIQYYCQAYRFNQAMQLAESQDMVASLVKPCVTEAFVSTSELLSEMKVQLTKQVPRLRQVRTKGAENPESYLEGQVEEDTPDNVSLAGTQASTNASFFTRYTGASGKTTQSKMSGKHRRRQERQRAKGKQGTIWEEEYLINSMRRLIIRLSQNVVDTEALVVALVRCGLRENATEVQTSIKSLITQLHLHKEEVFNEITTLPEEMQKSLGPAPDVPVYKEFKLC